MKRRWKVFLLIAGITGGIGIILLGTGIMLGATFEEVQIPYVERIHDRVQQNSEWDSGNQQEVRYDNVKNLDCEIYAGDVNVIQYEGSGVKVVSDLNLKTKYQYDEDDQTLTITSKKKHYREDDGMQLSIYVPNNLRFDEADFSLGAGIMMMDMINAKDLNVEVGAGEAMIEEFNVDDMSVSCGAGSLTLTTTAKLQDYNYEVTCGIGSVSIGDDDFSGLGSTKKMDYNADKEIGIECGIGEVAVYFGE